MRHLTEKLEQSYAAVVTERADLDEDPVVARMKANLSVFASALKSTLKNYSASAGRGDLEVEVSAEPATESGGLGVAIKVRNRFWGGEFELAVDVAPQWKSVTAEVVDSDMPGLPNGVRYDLLPRPGRNADDAGGISGKYIGVSVLKGL